MGTTQGCCVLFWTNTGSSTLQLLYVHLLPISQTLLGIAGGSEWHSPMDFYTRTYQCWPTSKNLHSSALCGHWMLFKGLMCGGWWGQIARENQRNLCCQLDNDDANMSSSQIYFVNISIQQWEGVKKNENLILYSPMVWETRVQPQVESYQKLKK